MTVNQDIRKLIELKKMSVKEMSEKINMSEKGFHDLLKRNDLKLSTLEKIAQALGVDIKYFFKDKNDNKFFSDNKINYQKQKGENNTLNGPKDELQTDLENAYRSGKEAILEAIIEDKEKIIKLHEASIDRLMQELDDCKNNHKLNQRL